MISTDTRYHAHLTQLRLAEVLATEPHDTFAAVCWDDEASDASIYGAGDQRYETGPDEAGDDPKEADDDEDEEDDEDDEDVEEDEDEDDDEDDDEDEADDEAEEVS